MNEMTPSKPTILVVDDIPENLRMLMETLGDDAYCFIPAKSGESALEKAKTGRKPDLILLDIKLPGIDGYEVLSRLKQAPDLRGIPVIFITATSEAMDGARGFHLGAVDYITKPFIPEVVRARVATHVELKRKTDLLEKLAATDSLTGVFNRREIDRILESEFQRAIRAREPLSVAFIDIDHFKRFNDTYGHTQGDTCLKTITTAIRQSLKRPTDALGRYGGEEFVAVLPLTDEAGAARIAGRFLSAVAAIRIPHGDSPTADHVTVSIGAATTRPVKDGPTTHNLLETADKMLYAAKKNGRNRTCAAELARDGAIRRADARIEPAPSPTDER